MPALPLDEAGKYVAAAYVVFVALILIYVAIIGARSRASSVRSRSSWRTTSDRRAAHARRQPQDRAASAARAPGAARRTRGARALASSWTTRPCTRPWRSPPATARSSTSSTADPVEAENAALGVLSRQAGLRPTELLGRDLLAPRQRRRRAPLRGHERARLHDRGRGRGPGPGEALVRDGARGGRDRAGHEQAVPRRARPPASACGPRPTCRARACPCPRWP